ncbi:putative membrane protein [Neisseria meningitidis 94018]|nr:putative membrane protein [Neisseria meningitidis 94018]
MEIIASLYAPSVILFLLLVIALFEYIIAPPNLELNTFIFSV